MEAGRPNAKHAAAAPAGPGPGAGESLLRIGDVARAVGTTPRTIRYYEEFGLLAAPPAHEKGRHRTYDEADVRRLQELIRLRDLLGVSLEELKSLVEAEEARAILRERWQHTEGAADRRAILQQSVGHVTARYDARTGTVLAMGAIDNLVKGASGQAVQAANLVLGLPETTGLPTIGLWP